jgi:hypothetical protein
VLGAAELSARRHREVDPRRVGARAGLELGASLFEPVFKAFLQFVEGTARDAAIGAVERRDKALQLEQSSAGPAQEFRARLFQRVSRVGRRECSGCRAFEVRSCRLEVIKRRCWHSFD